jgi:hypothetical protein
MKAKLFFLYFLSLILSGCTNLWITESTVDSSQAPTVSEPFHSNTAPTTNSYFPEQRDSLHAPDVEVLWAIPSTPVERYTIRYGYTRDSLTDSITVSTDALEKYADPTHGYVYRYLLKGIPADRTLYVSLIAHSGNESSPQSTVFEIPGR